MKLKVRIKTKNKLHLNPIKKKVTNPSKLVTITIRLNRLNKLKKSQKKKSQMKNPKMANRTNNPKKAKNLRILKNPMKTKM